MVISMTGFARETVSIKGQPFSIEIKSVNSKYLDLSCLLPGFLKFREMELRKLLGKEMIRGKVECKISLDNADLKNQLSLNKPIIKKLYRELLALGDELQWKESSNYLDFIAKMPEATHNPEIKIADKEWKQIISGCTKAIKNHSEYRKREGKAIEKDMVSRINKLEKLVGKIEKLEPGRIKKIAAKLNGLQSKHLKNRLEDNRLEEEMIYYLEKLDITEERVRFFAHCDHFNATLKEKKAMGKKLGFITQELLREANTIGSKAGNAEIQKTIVEVKDEIEKIKEQIFNIL